MNRKSFIYIGLFIIVAVLAGLAYLLRPTPEASAPIEAVPVEVEEQPPAEENAENTPEVPQAEGPPAEEGPAAGAAIFSISQDDSFVTFTLDEVLRGTPTTVVGVTDQVAGEISVNFDNPAASQVGVITINARTLQTDNDFRNRAINNEILDTGPYEFITFTPTEILGLPESAAIGDTITFQIVGDLTIRDITNTVTFDVTVTLVSSTELEGYASTEVLRSDYDLVIPSVPSVANVTDEVLLEIEFVAVSN